MLLSIMCHVDDAPSAVCFALTNKRHYDLVLDFFETTQLKQICPKDVRSHFPARLEPDLHQILTPLDHAAPTSDPAWIFFHLTATLCQGPSRIYLGPGQLAWRENSGLAIIRRLTWLIDGTGAASSGVDADAVLGYKLLLRPQFSIGNQVGISDCVLPTNSMYSRTRIQISHPPGVTFDQAHEECLDTLLKMWDQPIIKSMEYLELKELLADWERGSTRWDRFWANMVDNFEFNVPGDVEAYLEEQET